MKTIIIIGQGQLGFELTQRHLQAGHNVYSISRSSHEPISSSHTHIVADLDQLDSRLPIAETIDTLYYLAPPSNTDLHDRRMQAFLKYHVNSVIKHIIYISTTGVYGDSHGQWITEETLTRPAADRAKRRLDAEQQLIAFQQHNTAVSILRCAAIYSAKTINRKKIAANKKPVIKQSQAPYTNRISLADLTEVCWQAMLQPANKIEIYNVSDGRPSTTTEHAWLLSDLTKNKRNKEINLSEADQFYSPAYLEYLHESKKIDISKLKSKLKPIFQFENCQQGIEYYLQQEE